MNRTANSIVTAFKEYLFAKGYNNFYDVKATKAGVIARISNPNNDEIVKLNDFTTAVRLPDGEFSVRLATVDFSNIKITRQLFHINDFNLSPTNNN